MIAPPYDVMSEEEARAILGRVTATGGGGGGGPSRDFCEICPPACAGDSWSRVPADTRERCFAALVELVLEKVAVSPRGALEAPDGSTASYS